MDELYELWKTVIDKLTKDELTEHNRIQMLLWKTGEDQYEKELALFYEKMFVKYVPKEFELVKNL